MRRNTIPSLSDNRLMDCMRFQVDRPNDGSLIKPKCINPPLNNILALVNTLTCFIKCSISPKTFRQA